MRKIVYTFQTFVEHQVPGVGLAVGGDGHTDVLRQCLEALNRYYTGKSACPAEPSEDHEEAHRNLHAGQRAQALGVVYSDGNVRIIPLP